jgi:hypothetical protein
LLDLSESLGLRVSLEALDNIQTGEGVLEETKLVQPAFFQMLTDFAFDLRVAFREIVALVETEGFESRKGVQNLCFLFRPGRTGSQSPVEIGVPNDEGPRVGISMGRRDCESFFGMHTWALVVPPAREGVRNTPVG